MNRITAIFFPPKCPYCSRIISHDMTECITCRAMFPKAPRIEPLPGGEICIAPFSYDSRVRAAIEDYKFRGKSFNCHSFGSAVANAIKTVYYKDMEFEVITSVPMSVDRKHKRGFNQSELIARYAAKLLGKPYVEMMYRDKGGAVQHELTIEQRRNKPEDHTFHAIDPEKIKERSILLIDDIITSGVTMSDCCRVLKENGAERILCAAAAMSLSYNVSSDKAFSYHSAKNGLLKERNI